MNEFIWAHGCRISKKDADPQVVGETINELSATYGGRITPRIVVEAARPQESPLHNCFEWDDARAAELYRDDQARHVLSSIRLVRREDGRKDPEILHAFVSLSENVDGQEARAYVPLARVLADDELLNRAVNSALAELRAFEDRYASFDGIARAVRAARAAIATPAQDAAA